MILFGSIARGDWHSQSDIDLFILGRDDDFEQAMYERKLGREIQLFRSASGKELRRLKSALLLSILEGEIIKGDAGFLEVRCAQDESARASV